MLFSNIARVAKFYHWTEPQVLELTPNKFWAYTREIGVLQAEEQLRNISLINYEKAKPKDMRRIIRQYQKISDPFFKERQAKLTEMSLKSLKGKFGYKGKR